jgi:hypothetical protein
MELLAPLDFRYIVTWLVHIFSSVYGSHFESCY